METIHYDRVDYPADFELPEQLKSKNVHIWCYIRRLSQTDGEHRCTFYTMLYAWNKDGRTHYFVTRSLNKWRISDYCRIYQGNFKSDEEPTIEAVFADIHKKVDEFFMDFKEHGKKV